MKNTLFDTVIQVALFGLTIGAVVYGITVIDAAIEAMKIAV